MQLENLHNDLERAHYLQNTLIAHATGQSGDDAEYIYLRHYFQDNASTAPLLPEFVRSNRDTFQFWQFIKSAFSTYSERRTFIYEQFSPLLNFLEGRSLTPSDSSISIMMQAFDEENVQVVWQRALERRDTDPEGAITTARTLLETVCKHILDDCGVEYDDRKVELHQLYRLVAVELSLAPEQHSEEVFKQILGGCSAVVNGLGTLRNRVGDAHGKGKRQIRPSGRHAKLAVNLSGALSLFLVETFIAHKSSDGGPSSS